MRPQSFLTEGACSDAGEQDRSSGEGSLMCFGDLRSLFSCV